ncbi:MAG: CBS domain-containing protein [Nitrospinae bacterium]|nr:CBS domain-containing protein [Nitrospinota bacterium]
MFPVKKIMSKNVTKLPADKPVSGVVVSMQTSHCGSVVIAEGDEYVGIITERDLVLKVMGTGKDLEKTLNREIMSSPVMTIDEEAGIIEANDLMDLHQIRHLVVVNKKGEMVGVVSVRDLLHPVYLGDTTW